MQQYITHPFSLLDQAKLRHDTACAMASTYTQDDWLALFDRAGRDLPKTPVVYKAPAIGTTAFAQTIDHTLLKLEATAEQVDALCEEARRFGFKVCDFVIYNTAICVF